jgi:hypothetical protein
MKNPNDYKSLKFRVSDDADKKIRSEYERVKKDNALTSWSISDFLRHLVEIGLRFSPLVGKNKLKE